MFVYLFTEPMFNQPLHDGQVPLLSNTFPYETFPRSALTCTCACSLAFQMFKKSDSSLEVRKERKMHEGRKKRKKGKKRKERWKDERRKTACLKWQEHHIRTGLDFVMWIFTRKTTKSGDFCRSLSAT